MKKRILAALLSATMLATALAGCNGKSALNASSQTSAASQAGADNLTAPGEFPIVKEKETLSVAYYDRTTIGPLEDSEFYKWYEEKTNVKVEFTGILKEVINEKVNLMIVSGNLPDALLSLAISNADQVKYGSEGVYLPLNDLIEKCGVETKKLFEEYPEGKASITAPDGNIYSMPNINDCFHCRYPQRAWINTTWLNKLGLEIPQTTAEFEAVLQAFKDKDPNGNGKADEIPMTGYDAAYTKVTPFLASAFLLETDSNTVSNRHLYIDENKKIQFTGDKDEYREALTWINSLIEKGLVDPGSLTQTRDQVKQLVQNPEAALVGVFQEGAPSSLTGLYGATPDNRITQYAALPPLEGPHGFRGTPSNPTQGFGGGSFLITKNCKNPEMALRWADGHSSEEATINAWYGFEGVGYNKPAEGAVGLNGEPALFEQIIIPDESPEQTRLIQNYLGNNSAKLREGVVADPSTEKGKYELEYVLYTAAKESYAPYSKVDMTVPGIFWTPEEASEFLTLNTQINEYFDENTSLFLLGSKSLEKDWEAYIAELDKLGLPRMLELLQSAYERQYK